MIVDGRSVPNDHVIETEVCIVGAGAAGISIAKELVDASLHVTLIESGDFEFDAETQSLYEGRTIGQNYGRLDSTRLRYFGGTTNHWSGYCRPFSDADFDKRDWMPNSGWPIKKSDLDPYYERAFSICQLGRGIWRWDTDFWRTVVDGEHAMFKDSIFETIVTQITPYSEEHQRSFGSYYRTEIKNGNNVTVYLNSNVVRLDTDNTGQVIESVRVACLSGTRFTIRARIFVLAVGGIENPRLLLASNDTHATGLGNEFDMVGRCFMDHFYFPTAKFLLSGGNRTAIPDPLLSKNETSYGVLSGELRLSPRVREREEIGTVTIRFNPVTDPRYVEASHSKGAASVREMLGAFGRAELPDEFLEHVRNVIVDMDDIALLVYQTITSDEIPISHHLCTARIEPAPNPDSRVTLIEERDSLGVPKVKLDWRLSELDEFSTQRTMELLGLEAGRLGVGRVQMDWDASSDWPEDMNIGYHHMGTTRMSDTQRNGVVDKNCRVHGVHNLFVAGSSVFATAGSGTPTMAIVALALRLADHVKGLIE